MAKHGSIKPLLQEDEFWKLDKKVKAIIMEEKSVEQVIMDNSIWKTTATEIPFSEWQTRRAPQIIKKKGQITSWPVKD